tara:strand:+ start:26637 stop:27215 length:579 start_codon:yes stop_codon:yes gene_type:complete
LFNNGEVHLASPEYFALLTPLIDKYAQRLCLPLAALKHWGLICAGSCNGYAGSLDFRQELTMLVPRLTAAFSLALLTACAQTPSSVTLEQKQQNKCPLSLQVGQQFILRLPSNPTTGFRWLLRDSAPQVLQSLGPEVYSNPEDAGLVGSAGVSIWRFQVAKAGEGQLALSYERPWEVGVVPAQRFECTISAE